ncbi:hypothetical protein [Haloarcula halophila]|uniref:hypothetical protein n=1 Tax=Haloarcula TaxID=2237 RepID=UPI0023E4514D|nr:hypothetical protein [Halomicroarcula sp. DFY41]
MTRTPTVLYLDSETTQLDLYERTAALEPEWFEPSVTADSAEARARVESDGADCLVTAQRLGSTTGLSVARSLREAGHDLPIVLHSWEVPDAVLTAEAPPIEAVVTKRTLPRGYRYLHRTVEQVIDEPQAPTA